MGENERERMSGTTKQETSARKTKGRGKKGKRAGCVKLGKKYEGSETVGGGQGKLEREKKKGNIWEWTWEGMRK